MTIPLGEFLRNLPPPPESSQAPLSSADPASAPMVPASPRPQWQVTLDRALIGVGRGVERSATRFREAPQNTQIIVVIVAGTIAILVIGFVLFLAVH